MKTQKLLLICCVLLINLSCNQIYWQRNKIRVSSRYRNQRIELIINNTTPQIFTQKFEAELREACKKEFKRIGAIVDFTEKPDFTATVTIKTDSFNIKGTYALTVDKESTWHMYKKDHVKAILFNYSIFDLKRNLLNWTQQNDIYYFNDETRNSRRSINMIRYSIRYGL